jgi:hypothetical protein
MESGTSKNTVFFLKERIIGSGDLMQYTTTEIGLLMKISIQENNI